MNTLGLSTAVAALLTVSGLAPATQGAETGAANGAEDMRAFAKPGRYKGVVYDKGEKPSSKAWVRFRVGRKGKRVIKYRSRVWVTCWAGGTTYLSLPVKFKAPSAKIRRNGRVDRRWKRKFTVDGEKYKLRGRLKLNLRRPKHVRGHIRLEFGHCWTGREARYGKIKAKRLRR